jgi:hypothetical protein
MFNTQWVRSAGQEALAETLLAMGRRIVAQGRAPVWTRCLRWVSVSGEAEGGGTLKNWLAGAALAAGLMVAGTASAENYRFVSGNKAEIYYLNSDRTVQSGGNPVVWYTRVLRQPDSWKGKLIRFEIWRAEFNCKMGMMRALAVFSYTADAALVASENEPTSWRSNPPGSMGDMLTDVVCKGISIYPPYDLSIPQLLAGSDRVFTWMDKQP